MNCPLCNKSQCIRYECLDIDNTLLPHYDGNGHLVIFNQCILCNFWIPLKYSIRHRENGWSKHV